MPDPLLPVEGFIPSSRVNRDPDLRGVHRAKEYFKIYKNSFHNSEIETVNYTYEITKL